MKVHNRADSPCGRAILVFVLVLIAGALRIAPHPWNFTPVGAMALFAGAVMRDRRIAFVLPLLAMLPGDLFLGFNRLTLLVYASFLVSVAIGRFLCYKRTLARIGGATLLGALQFFLVTNFGVWALLGSYPHTVSGVLACYAAGIPFFWNTLAADAFYAVLLFGSVAIVEHLFPVLRDANYRAAL